MNERHFIAVYDVMHERDGLQYEIVDTGKVGLFGEPIIRACTFGVELVPKSVRRTLGTFSNRHEAEACLNAALARNLRNSEGK
jgi:hypothetical protein